MSETPAERKDRVQRWTNDHELCADCGLLRINVRHEPDPENAPEGMDYYRAMRDKMHAFVPSGRYDR
jgi:hypothetical protein